MRFSASRRHRFLALRVKQAPWPRRHCILSVSDVPAFAVTRAVALSLLLRLLSFLPLPLCFCRIWLSFGATFFSTDWYALRVQLHDERKTGQRSANYPNWTKHATSLALNQHRYQEGNNTNLLQKLLKTACTETANTKKLLHT